jgi:hypothetical protein
MTYSVAITSYLVLVYSSLHFVYLISEKSKFYETCISYQLQLQKRILRFVPGLTSSFILLIKQTSLIVITYLLETGNWIEAHEQE